VGLVVYDSRDRRYVPLLPSLGSAVLATMVIGGVAFEAGRARQAEPLGGVSGPAAAVRTDPACELALRGADDALALAARLDRALGEQASVLQDLQAERLTRQQALSRAVPPLTAAAADRRAFRDALTTYQVTRADCSG
jgi:hypothetical protein